jgi:hypothetical protein
VNVTGFTNESEYSRLRCHHTSTYSTRWCEFVNVAYFDHTFTFLSPVRFKFPNPFIVPGPRAPPFDKSSDRFTSDPVVLPLKISQIPRSLEVVPDFCYIYGVFHNYFMLWHTVFDFIVPLYAFMKMLNRSETRDNRRVYVRSDGVWSFHAMMKVLSAYPVTIIDQASPSLLMHRGTIGIEKLEKDTRLNRTYDESIGFRYDFNRSIGTGLREDLLTVLGFATDAVGDRGKPLAVLIDRKGQPRNIQNSDAVRELMETHCPHCSVVAVELHNMEVEPQIELISRASVLVGLHGSGLAHAVWMRESAPNHTTHLVEILPYNYTCRDWYHTAAIVAGVQYHIVMNEKVPAGSHLGTCWARPEMCATLGCHDALRDQPTRVEAKAFTDVWTKIADELKYTIVTE